MLFCGRHLFSALPIFMSSIPMKGSLLLFDTSIVKLIDGWASFNVARKAVAAGISFLVRKNLYCSIARICICIQYRFLRTRPSLRIGLMRHITFITQDDLVELLRVATKHQLFQFNGSLYEQIDGVAMGSPLGPLMVNTLMCFTEEKLESENKLPSFCKRYVDDTLAAVKDIPAATAFLATLNEAHPSISFAVEVSNNNKLPFVGMELIKIGKR